MDLKKSLIIAVFIIAFFVRFIRLGDVPVGFHRDEAFLGYNAYSILKTGKDINGNLLPLHLESFIYSPAGYSYFAVPSISLFGLSSFSVRFPSAFFGSLTVVILFFLIRKLFREFNLALFSSLFLALSPWHINLSRTATENTLVVFFITLGLFLYLIWTGNKKSLFLFLSFLSFSLTILIYQAPRAFLPFFIPLVILCFSRSLGTRIQNIALYLVIILIPLFLILSSPNLSSRIRTLNIFNHPQTQLTIDENVREDGVSDIPNLESRLFHNKLLDYSSLISQNYFKHFSYDFLFTENGYPQRYIVPGMGLLYLFELPLLFLGAYFILKAKKRLGIFILGWVFLAPLGSALTFDDVPNLQRTLIIFPALSIISGAGFFYLFQITSKKKYSKIILSLLFLVIIYNFAFYIHQYYVHGIKHRPWYRHEGYKELVEKVNNLLPNYKSSLITNRETAPTIFFLFYSQYNPTKFQAETKGKFGIESDTVNFYKYSFTDKECPVRTLNSSEKTDEKMFDFNTTGERGVLYVNSGNCEIPKAPFNELSAIKRSDGTVVFRILSIK